MGTHIWQDAIAKEVENVRACWTESDVAPTYRLTDVSHPQQQQQRELRQPLFVQTLRL